MAVGQLKAGLERTLANADDPTARQMAETQIKQLTQLIEETDTLTLGWQVDPKQRTTHFDVLMTAVADSEMSKQIEAQRNAKTRFGGFIADGAALRVNLASQMLPSQVDEAIVSVDRFEQQTLEQVEDDGDIDNRTRAAAKQLIQTFFQIARSTIKTGNFDSCTSVVLKPQAISVISASHVASGNDVEQAVKQLVELAKNESEFSFSNVKLNADQHAGVRFHTLALPIPETEDARKVLGDTLDIVVGVADNSAYVALGPDGLTQLKKAIDASQGAEQTVEPFQLEVGLLPVLSFAQTVEPNPMVEAVVQMLSGVEGKDHLRVRTSVTDAGIRYRIELEEGVLKILGQAGQMVGVGAF
jgi:hypothetical protein